MSDHHETRCPSCGGSDEQGCYTDCPTHHITALEARVRELEEALRTIMGDVEPQDDIYELARAALNQEKQK